MSDEKLVKKIYADLQYSASKLSKLHKAIEEDFEFVQGQQWEDEDVQRLYQRGVKALTINKIKPVIKLLSGIERQARSDFKAFPEGNEDSVVAEMVTRLMKNRTKVCNVNEKLSTQFKNSSIGGVCFIEPYLDYAYNLINGDLKFKTISSLDVFFDPDFKEYDMSDSKFMIKLTKEVSKDDLISMFPNKKNIINKLEGSRIDIGALRTTNSVIGDRYPRLSEGELLDFQKDTKDLFDLLDYYYIAYEPRWFVIQQEQGIIKQIDEKEKAIELASQLPNAQIVEKDIPVVRMANVVGNTLLNDDIAWFYPMWKQFPLIPCFFEMIDEELPLELRIQGIVRSIKDMQSEFNKRRTQELHHLNSSVNSGIFSPKGALDEQNMNKLKEFGSSPGVVIEYDSSKGKPEKEYPTPLSQGHAQLAAESAQDLKEASGVNPDLLANDSQSQSGRAILLKQKQGLVMVQEAIDNLSTTKRLIGKFMLSQLRQMFTVESAMRVLGDSFINENFKVPVNAILTRGLEKVQAGEQPTELEQNILLKYSQQNPQQPILDEQGQLAMTVDMDAVAQTINTVLNDSELGIYDVSIGEGAYSETVKLSNFLDLKELATQGVPIPPQVLIETSMLAEEDKKKIIAAMQQQMMMAQQQQEQQSNNLK